MDLDEVIDIQIEESSLNPAHTESIDLRQTTTAIEINNSVLELVVGDITKQNTDSVVNAANRRLAGGGGVDGAIHQAAGPQLAKASKLLAPCDPGEAVLTPGYDLTSKWVIHTVGPIYSGGIRREAKILSVAYRNSLRIATQSRFASVAFPSISTGIYGYPIDKAAKIALQTTMDIMAKLDEILLVRFVLYSQQDFQVYRQVLEDAVEKQGKKWSDRWQEKILGKSPST